MYLLTTSPLIAEQLAASWPISPLHTAHHTLHTGAPPHYSLAHCSLFTAHCSVPPPRSLPPSLMSPLLTTHYLHSSLLTTHYLLPNHYLITTPLPPLLTPHYSLPRSLHSSLLTTHYPAPSTPHYSLPRSLHSSLLTTSMRSSNSSMRTAAYKKTCSSSGSFERGERGALLASPSEWRHIVFRVVC